MKFREGRTYDLIVCGAGSAGFCAAVAAARLGASVALVEKYDGPGGILTVLGNNSIDRFNNPFRKNRKMVIAGIGWELVMRLYRDGFASVPDMDAPYCNHWQYGVKVNPVAAAKVIDDLLLEAGVALYYGQPVVDVETEDNRIAGVWISSKAGLQCLRARLYLDCTGDGDLAHWAGAQTWAGDEKGSFQPGTLRFYPAVDAQDRILNYGDNQNHVALDVTDSDRITQAEIQSRRMIYAGMQEEGQRIMAVAPAVAPREGRRIAGLSVMNAEDYCDGVIFEDSVCYSHWFVDIHRDGQPAYIRYLRSEKTPTIRLSALISKDLSNLMMAGRCVSSDRETNSALRVKASCMAMGQAAGTAAALAIRDKKEIAALSAAQVKASLDAQGAIVPGLRDGMEFSELFRP